MSGAPLTTVRLQVRGVHPYVLRSGQWADVISMVWCSPQDGSEPGWPCVVVMFPDQITDVWSIAAEPQHYEFRPAP